MIAKENINQLFYDAPEDNGVHELSYNKDSDSYVVRGYAYPTIINCHNGSITDEEFAYKLRNYASYEKTYRNNSKEYAEIDNIALNELIIPGCMGPDRRILYSWASKHILNRTCKDCLYANTCMFKKDCENCNACNNCHEPCSCKKFIDVDSISSVKTNKILRVYYANEISKFTYANAFYCWMNTCDVNKALLNSLNINYIVFVSINGRIAANGGHAQVYDTEDKAKAYAEAVLNTKVSEFNKFGFPDTLTVDRPGEEIVINYKTKFGSQTIRIHVLKV